ncbi:MAG TPA: ATP-dependent DNA ligase [Gaiellales bacterium]|nr:ATP-dependent DNA ligase [Gaiellales bacterium]
MTLPLEPPLLPQLARSASELPDGDGWVFERKWDGFRAIAFVDGDELHLQSRNGRPLVRYFPELRFPPGRYVLDGELVIRDSDGGEEFDALQERIHPAASRVAMLAERTPARFVAFDLLAHDDRSLLELPFSERRAALEEMIAEPLELATATTDRDAAAGWLRDTEGVIAKRVDSPYLPGKREGMLKIKRVRTIDCVAVGWRPGKAKGTVGSIILGLYDDGEEPAVVGHTSGFTAARARELVGVLAPYESGEHGTGAPSRWSADRDLEWRALRPELVVEVSFDHRSGRRIRHGAKLLRLRDDRDPRSCRIDQLDT